MVGRLAIVTADTIVASDGGRRPPREYCEDWKSDAVNEGLSGKLLRWESQDDRELIRVKEDKTRCDAERC